MSIRSSFINVPFENWLRWWFLSMDTCWKTMNLIFCKVFTHTSKFLRLLWRSRDRRRNLEKTINTQSLFATKRKGKNDSHPAKGKSFFRQILHRSTINNSRALCCPYMKVTCKIFGIEHIPKHDIHQNPYYMVMEFIWLDIRLIWLGCLIFLC